MFGTLNSLAKAAGGIGAQYVEAIGEAVAPDLEDEEGYYDENDNYVRYRDEDGETSSSTEGLGHRHARTESVDREYKRLIREGEQTLNEVIRENGLLKQRLADSSDATTGDNTAGDDTELVASLKLEVVNLRGDNEQMEMSLLSLQEVKKGLMEDLAEERQRIDELQIGADEKKDDVKDDSETDSKSVVDELRLTIETLKNEVSSLKAKEDEAFKSSSSEFRRVCSELSTSKSQAASFTEDIASLKAKCELDSSRLIESDRSVQSLQSELEWAREETMDAKTAQEEADKKALALSKEVITLKYTKGEVEGVVVQLRREVEEMGDLLKKRADSVEEGMEKQTIIDKMKSVASASSSALKERDEMIADKETVIEKLQAEVSEKERENIFSADLVLQKDGSIADKDATINVLKADVVAREGDIKVSAGELRAKVELITLKEGAINKLQADFDASSELIKAKVASIVEKDDIIESLESQAKSSAVAAKEARENTDSVSDAVSSLQSDIESKACEVDALSEELNVEKAENLRLKKQMGELKESVSQMLSDDASKSVEDESLSVLNALLEKENRDLASKDKATKEKLSKVEGELKKSKESCKNLKTKLEKESRNREEASNEVKIKMKVLELLEERLKAGSDKVEVLEDNLKVEEASVKELEHKLQAEEASVKGFEEKMDNMKLEASSSSEKEKAAIVTVQELEDKLKAISISTIEKEKVVEELKGKLKAGSVAVKALEETLEAEVTSGLDKVKIVDELKKEKISLTETTTNLKSELGQLQGEYDTDQKRFGDLVDSLKSEIEGSKGEGTSLNETVAELRDSVKSLNDQMKNKAEEMASKSEEILTLNSKVSELEKALMEVGNSTKSGEAELVRQSTELTKQVENLNKFLDEKNVKLRKSELACTDRKNELAGAQAQLTKVQRQLTEASEKSNSENSANDIRLERLMKESQVKMEKTLRESSEKSHEVEQLKQVISNMRGVVSKSAEEVEKYSGYSEALEKKCDSLEKELNDLRVRSSEAEAAVNSLEAERGDFPGLQDELRRLEEEGEERKAAHRKLEIERDALRLQENELNSRFVAARADLDLYKVDLERSNTGFSNLQMAMENFQSERESELAMMEQANAEAVAAEREACNTRLAAMADINSSTITDIRNEAKATVLKANMELEKAKEQYEGFRIESVGLRRSLDEAILRLQVSQEDIIDRATMKNILLDWHGKTGQGKKQVMGLMASILNFNEDEKDRAGLVEKEGVVGTVVGAAFAPLPPAKVDVGELEGDSVKDKWVSFLLAESAEGGM